MRLQRRLHLEGADPVAGGEDDVVVAALEEEVAVGVGADQVAGRPPLAREALAVEVVAEEGGGGGDAQLQFTHFVSRRRLRFASGGGYPDLEAGEGFPHRPLPDRLAGEVRR